MERETHAGPGRGKLGEETVSRAGKSFFLAYLREIGLNKNRANECERIATHIKALQPKASNRQIAKTIGADERTVRRDTAANAAPVEKTAKENRDESGRSAANAAPSGAQAAKLIDRRATGKAASLASLI